VHMRESHYILPRVPF